MKLVTLGALCAGAMTLSSWTTWKATAPASGGGARTAVATFGDTPGGVAAPTVGASFSRRDGVELEGRLGHATVPADREAESFLLVDVRPESAAGGFAFAGSATSSTPLELVIVIDRSGSMRGKRLANALAGARGMVDRLREGDVVSVVAYDTTADVIVPSMTVGFSTRELVARALDGVTARGDTCISCGIERALQILRERSGSSVERVLLLSDGEATAGVRSVEGFRRLAEDARVAGVALSTVGVDVEYDERVLAALAQESNGRHYFVESPSGLPLVFDRELETLAATVARDLELEVEPAPGVEIQDVVDRNFRREGRRIVVSFGTLAASEEKTLLARVRIARGAAATRPVADVRLRFRDLTTGTSRTLEGQLSVDLSDDPSQSSQLDPVVAARLQRSETAATLTETNRLFDQGLVGEARRALDARIERLQSEEKTAVARAPAPKKSKVEADFARQRSALGSARDGFSSGPIAASPSSGSFAKPPSAESAPGRAGAAQVRKNQQAAVELSF